MFKYLRQHTGAKNMVIMGPDPWIPWAGPQWALRDPWGRACCPAAASPPPRTQVGGQGCRLRAGPATLTPAAPSLRRTARPHSGVRPGMTPLRSEGISVPSFSRERSLSGSTPRSHCRGLSKDRVHFLLHEKLGKACMCVMQSQNMDNYDQ